MEPNNEIIHAAGQPEQETSSDADAVKLAGLYLSTTEVLARYAQEATAKQQLMNILAQRLTAESTRTLYSIFD